METSALLSLGLALLSKIAGNAVNSSLSRGDFKYSHSMTNIPAQVNEMREAGLNPALAYGQISAPQGQSLGNYNSDFLEGLKDIQNSAESRANTEYRKAETDLLKKQAEYIVQKTKNEAMMGLFDVNHQQERYDLEISGKGLVNAGLQLQNEGYQLDNAGKLISNEIGTIQRDIAEFDRAMKKIDAEKHRDYVEAELSRIVANTFMTIAETNALNKKLPYELMMMSNLIRNYRLESNLKMKDIRLKELTIQVEEYLRKNGLQGYVLQSADISNIIGKLVQSFGNATGYW